MSVLERDLGASHAADLWALCEEAKAIIAERIARHDIRCDWRPGNLLASTRERYMGWIESEAEFCHRRFGYDGYRMLSRAEMREEVASECYVGGRMDEGGGHLHPLRFVLGMAAAAAHAGVRIFEGSRVERIRWGLAGAGVHRRRGRRGGLRRPRRQRLPRAAGAAHRVPDHADRQPRAGHRAARRTPRPLPRSQRRVRARDQVRRRLLPVHDRPPAAVRRRRDLLGPPARRPEGVRPALHAPGVSPACGHPDRLRVERPPRDHEEPTPAHRTARPERLLSRKGSRATAWP